MIKKTFIVAVLLIIFAAGWIVGLSWRPAYPEQWEQITVGTPVSEALRFEPRLSSAMRSEKGFDQATIDFGDRYWQLLVWVDSNLQIRSVEKIYVFRPCGLWNTTIVRNAK